MSAEGIEPFLTEARIGGCVRCELRVDGARDEASSIVRSWPLDDKPATIAAIAGKIAAVGESDSRNLMRGSTRYVLLAWSEQGPWGRHTISFGNLEEAPRATFQENDATAQGMVAEAIRDRQYGQKMNYNAMQLVVNHLSAMVDRFAAMHDRTEAKYIELVTAFEKVISMHEDRQIKREELRLKAATQERMVDTIVPLVTPIANRVMAHVTGHKGVLAPEMFDRIVGVLMRNEDLALKWAMSLPENEQPVFFELMQVFEQRATELKKAELAEAERKKRIEKEQNGTLGPNPSLENPAGATP